MCSPLVPVLALLCCIIATQHGALGFDLSAFVNHYHLEGFSAEQIELVRTKVTRMARHYQLHDWEGMSVKDLVRANKACANNPVQPTADGHDSIAIKDQMSMCGFVVLRDLFPEDMIAEVEKVVSRQFQHAARSSHVHRDTAGFVKRGSKRFEMGLEAILEQFVKPKLLYNDKLMDVVEDTLGESVGNIELDTLSTVTSLPGAQTQHWHSDFGHLFESRDELSRLTNNIAAHQPAHAVVVFIPLVDVPQEMGPTEIASGSHLLCNRSFITEVDTENKANGPRNTIDIPVWSQLVRPSLQAGDALILDLRVLHRGGANNGKRDRPMLYLQYAHEWFVDSVNFSGRQTRKLDTHSREVRKLIRRLDARRYVQELEGKLRELGVDLTALRSQQTDVGEDEEGAIDMKINAEDLQDIKNLDIYQDDFL